MDKVDLVKEWRRYADDDLRIAEHTANTTWPVPYHIVCYHCEQSAEKYLKGFLILHDETVPHNHDLDSLCELCKKYSPLFSEIEQNCSDVTLYGTQPRYPLEMRVEKSDMNRALYYTKGIRSFMQRVAPEMFEENQPEGEK